jgi:hypothetical protein
MRVAAALLLDSAATQTTVLGICNNIAAAELFSTVARLVA